MLADFFTAIRLPLAVAFPLVGGGWRLVVLALAAGSDQLFMVVAFGTVLASGALSWWELVGVLARDIVASVAFLVVSVRGRASSIPARAGGKAVTVMQVATLFAFVLDSPYLHPLAHATAAIALYAIWDYTRAAPKASRPL